METLPNPGRDNLDQDQLDRLLAWLDPDRNKAGVLYEWIRRRLIKIFMCRGSPISEELADLTINRVARKLPEIQSSYTGDPARYFCGVAHNIFRESLRTDKPPAVMQPARVPADEDEERRFACLEKCIEKLAEIERDLVIAYYQEEKHAKIDHRKKLAEQLGVGLNALRIRAHRIRERLHDCAEDCLGAKG